MIGSLDLALGLSGFPAALGNRTDQSPRIEPIRLRTQWPLLKPRSTSHPFRYAPVSETAIQCDVTMNFHVIILSMKAEMHIRI
jgi:hypothetical protein